MSGTIRKAFQFTRIGLKAFALTRFNQEAGRRYLLQELGNLPGIPTKMSQILSMRFGIDPEKDAPTPQPIPLEVVKSIIEEQAPLLAKQLETISDHPLTASLGQVHEGTLHTGKDVAIKIRYPGIDRDLKQQLRIILGTMKTLPAPEAVRIDQDEYNSFLESFFSEETDYTLEAKAQCAFRNAWSNDFRFVIPEIIENLGSSCVLVQSYESSIPLSKIDNLTRKERIYYSEAFRDFFLNGALDFGLIHTDLHERNWGIRRDKAQIVFYDFGATLQLSSELRLILHHLSVLQSDDHEAYLSALCDLGFNRKKLLPIRFKLKELIALLFEPVRKPDWKPSTWKLQERIDDLLGSDKWNFRTAGPPWFLMLIRGLNGWLNALTTLEADSVPESSSIAGKLKVLVKENNQEKVSLEFPAQAVMDLEMLMPSGVSEKIREQGISLREISENSIRNGYQPGTLFESFSDGKLFRVWIE